MKKLLMCLLLLGCSISPEYTNLNKMPPKRKVKKTPYDRSSPKHSKKEKKTGESLEELTLKLMGACQSGPTEEARSLISSVNSKYIPDMIYTISESLEAGCDPEFSVPNTIGFAYNRIGKGNLEDKWKVLRANRLTDECESWSDYIWACCNEYEFFNIQEELDSEISEEINEFYINLIIATSIFIVKEGMEDLKTTLKSLKDNYEVPWILELLDEISNNIKWIKSSKIKPLDYVECFRLGSDNSIPENLRDILLKKPYLPKGKYSK